MTLSFRRVPDGRTGLVKATLNRIADLVIQAATARAVASHAGVSSGFVRHPGACKERIALFPRRANRHEERLAS